MLMEHETAKLKDLDEEYATELREWKAQLKPRKQVRNSVARYPHCLSHISIDIDLNVILTLEYGSLSEHV